jgi:hypothetical protein
MQSRIAGVSDVGKVAPHDCDNDSGADEGKPERCDDPAHFGDAVEADFAMMLGWLTIAVRSPSLSLNRGRSHWTSPPTQQFMPSWSVEHRHELWCSPNSR